MTRYRVIVELSARADIDDAFLWIEERSPIDAARWFNTLYQTIDSLELLPKRCPIAPESDFFDIEIREIFHGRRHNKYRILFTIIGKKAHVLHVRHGARRAIGEAETDE